MNGVIFVPVFLQVFKRVCLDKLKRIPGLRVLVYSDNIKACEIVSSSGTTRTTVQVKESRTHSWGSPSVWSNRFRLGPIE
jgi:hypothetical protein